MLWTLLKRTEWRPFLDLLSPSFFAVVPAGPLFTELKRLAQLYRSSTALAEACEGRRASLARASLPIDVASVLPPESGPPADAQARGQRVLELYFHQIFDDGPTLLDLRHARFAEASEGSRLVWQPSAALAAFTPTFRTATQALYRGFYRGDDALFESGLATLGLAEAADAIRAQFGAGQQDAVRFSLRDFQQKFQEVFVRCQKTGSRIDTQFLPLGLYLATLYEHLERLALPFDARAAYEVVDG